MANNEILKSNKSQIKGEMKMKINKKIKKIASALSLAVLLAPNMVYASTSTAQFDTIMEQFVVPWVQKIGGGVAFIGFIMFALAWKDDDAHKKTIGMNTLVAGFMVIAAATGYKMFIL